ncbi:MAG: hypothetical protein M3463_16240, partial [Verrucomicrobiota bacterium]|nr:hypothetical protein [Verrucomicrobiota bacterium]
SRTDPAVQTLPLASRRTGSRGELFAAAVATIQARSFIRRAPALVELVTIGALMLLALFIPSWSRQIATGILAMALLGYILFAVLFFGGTLLWMPLAVPAGLAVLLILFRLTMPDPPPGATAEAESSRPPAET